MFFKGRDSACVCVPLDVADIPLSGARFPVCGGYSTEPEHAELLRVARGELCGDVVSLGQYDAHWQAADAICVNDCKSLAHAPLSTSAAAHFALSRKHWAGESAQ